MPNVTFSNSGQSVEIEKGESLQPVIQDNGWPIPFGCGTGICGTCLVRVLKGKENLSPIDETEKQTLEAMGSNDGEHRLACKCLVQGDVTIEQ